MHVIGDKKSDNCNCLDMTDSDMCRGPGCDFFPHPVSGYSLRICIIGHNIRGLRADVVSILTTMLAAVYICQQAGSTHSMDPRLLGVNGGVHVHQYNK
jgi:hypothetical protein